MTGVLSSGASERNGPSALHMELPETLGTGNL